MGALDLLRVDHIGSLRRPQALLDLRARVDDGNATPEELAALEDETIREVIAEQERIGFPIVTDGEFRRSNFQDSFGASVSGYDTPESREEYRRWQQGNRSDQQQRVESGPQVAGPPVVTRSPAVERLTLTRNLPLEEYLFTAGAAHTTAKVTLIGPDRVAQRFDWQASEGVYEGLDDFTKHVADIQHEMVRQLVEAGCPYVHIDAPGYTAYVDEPSLAAMRSRGEDPAENLTRSIAADNRVIEGIEATCGIHLCRGNSRAIDPLTGRMLAQWHREGHYDAIAEQLFTQLNHKRLMLEYDSERCREFRAAALRAEGQDRCARARDDQEHRRRDDGRPEAPHRRGVALHRRRPARAQPAVRVRQRRRRRNGAGRHPVAQAGRDPGDGRPASGASPRRPPSPPGAGSPSPLRGRG